VNCFAYLFGLSCTFIGPARFGSGPLVCSRCMIFPHDFQVILAPENECKKSRLRRVNVPSSAFWLRSVLISFVPDSRLIEPHDINLISFLGCGSIRQLVARTCKRRHGIALSYLGWRSPMNAIRFNRRDPTQRPLKPDLILLFFGS